MKLKRLGLALLASLALGAMIVISASAKTGGHFVSDAAEGHTIVDQTAVIGTNHQIRIKIDENSGEFECKIARATGTAATGTVTQAFGNTELSQCFTVGTPEALFEIHENGCQALVTVAPGEPATTEHTGHLTCPVGKNVEITHPNCGVRVPSQTVSGITYTRITVNGKHAITADVNFKYILYYHTGLCIFLGTNHTATISGSTVIKGFDTQGNQVNITAT